MPLLLSTPRAAKHVGLSKDKFRLLKDLPRVKLGKREMFRVEDLETYFRDLARPVTNEQQDN